MAIAYFEKVRITKSERSPERIGCVGVLVGISSDDDIQVKAYGVYFEDMGRVLSFGPDEIMGLNEFVDKSELYDEKDRITVRVIDGKGHIVE